MKKRIKKITLSKIIIEQNEILQKSELKSIHGGYGYGGLGDYGLFYCIYENSGGIQQTPCSLQSTFTIVAFCYYYNSNGYGCRCYSC